MKIKYIYIYVYAVDTKVEAKFKSSRNEKVEMDVLSNTIR